MRPALSEIAKAVERALEEVAAAEEMALLRGESARHWAEAEQWFRQCARRCYAEQAEALKKQVEGR